MKIINPLIKIKLKLLLIKLLSVVIFYSNRACMNSHSVNDVYIAYHFVLHLMGNLMSFHNIQVLRDFNMHGYCSIGPKIITLSTDNAAFFICSTSSSEGIFPMILSKLSFATSTAVLKIIKLIIKPIIGSNLG